ncbi:hypothetical protein ACFS07_31495 [Undibacterium arcticum]
MAKILPRTKFTLERGMRMPEAVLGMTVTGNYPTNDGPYDRAISATDRDMIFEGRSEYHYAGAMGH